MSANRAVWWGVWVMLVAAACDDDTPPAANRDTGLDGDDDVEAGGDAGNDGEDTPPATTCPGLACDDGQVCAVVENDGHSALVPDCVDDRNAAASGTACGDDADCNSFLCISGFCADLCADGVSCPNGQTCTATAVERRGLTGNFEVCRDLGEDESCLSDRDCESGQVCGDLRAVGDEAAAFCTEPNEGGEEAGVACTDDDECRSDLCLSSTDECSSTCDNSALDCPDGQICTTFRVEGTPIGLCARDCENNADCESADGAEGNLCRITGNTFTNTNDTVCREPSGEGDLGVTCETGADCQSGLCLRSTRFTANGCDNDDACEGEEICRCPLTDANCDADEQRCATEQHRCTFLCADDEDCTGGTGDHGMTNCADDISVTLPDETGSADVSACSDRE